MNGSHQIIIVKGKELPPSDLVIINKARLEEFGSTNPIQPHRDNEDWNKIYFLLKDEDQLLSFGRLHEIRITFNKKIYNIFGIATVISLTKNKGYGTLLISSMKQYIKKSRKTAVGFCNKTITPFYMKNGFHLLNNWQQQFHFTSPSKYLQSDAIYIEGDDKLIIELHKYPHLIAELSRPHW